MLVEAARLAQELALRRERSEGRDRCLTDLHWLLVHGLSRPDCDNAWVKARCAEVQAAPDGFLDLWAREHYKSTVITFAKTIQDILRDPEITVGIFSHTRPIAKAFLRQIKREFEANVRLRGLFPDVIWDVPHKEAPKWSEDDGIIVKRSSNPKESTVEAWGLVDGQPTSKHFALMVYDDVVTADSVTNPDMIKKVTAAWEVSRNLTAEGGCTRYIGTRWHFADTYRAMLDRGAAIERRYPCTVDGTVDGEPVLMSRSTIVRKRRDQGPYTFASQMLLDPTADRTQGFRDAWIRHYEGVGNFGGMNKYLIVDPASEKKKTSDYTAMVVIGLGQDENFYLLDAVRDRLSLRERGDAVFALHRRWKPRAVGYERYGMMADVEYLKERMGRESYRFDIIELGGQIAKNDRIRRMIPIFEGARFLLPETLWKEDYEGRSVDLVHSFIEEEYKAFPVGMHDDMFDAISRIQDEDMPLIWPRPEEVADRYTRRRAQQRAASAWAA